VARILRVALIQPLPRGFDFTSPANVEYALDLLGRVCKSEVDVAIFPEYFPFHDDPRLSRVAVDCGFYVVAGVRYVEEGRAYNTATIYTPSGGVVRQGKRYVGRLEVRLWGFTGWPGDYVVVDTGRARLGVAVCADFWSFPEAAYELFLGGAEVFINPSYMFSLAGHWLKATQSRSLEFYTPVVGVDSAVFPLETGRRRFEGGGLSHVVVPPATREEAEEWWSGGAEDTSSWVRLKLGLGEEVGYYELDLDSIAELREDWWLRMRGVSLGEWLERARSRHRSARLVRA